MIGIDTLQANLAGFDVKAGHSLTIRPPAFKPSTGEVFGDFLLWPGQNGSSAHYNDDTGRFFVDVRVHGGRVGCSVHLSIPRYSTGGRSNLNLVDGVTTREVLSDLGRELRAVGVSTNLEEARLSRVDLTRNVQADEPFSVYRPMLGLIEGRRMRDRREYTDGFLFGNTAQAVCIYDKLEQLRAMKVDTPKGAGNVLRFEYRMKDARKCRDVLGFGNVQELLSEYGSIGDTYRTKMKEHVFRFSPGGLEVLSARRLEDELREFYELGGRNWFARWVEAVGVREILRLAQPDTVADVVDELTGSRNKSWRIAKKLKDARANTRLLSRDRGSLRTYRTLYGELRSKALAA